VITTFIHLVSLSILMGVASLFGIHLWIWLPAVCAITITIQLLAMNSQCGRLMEGFLIKHAEQFDDSEEIGMMKTSPGIFIPQVYFFTTFARSDMAASLGWVRISSFIAIVLGLAFRNYVVGIIGLSVFLIYLFTQIGGMFYSNNPEADMFGSVRRYLSKIGKNVKSMTDMELQIYVIKYRTIVEKLRSIEQ
jgi:hypothetical protein